MMFDALIHVNQSAAYTTWTWVQFLCRLTFKSGRVYRPSADLQLLSHLTNGIQPLHHRVEALHQHADTRHVTNTLDLALEVSGCEQVHVVHKPRLLSDNGSSYVSSELAAWLQGKGMKHSRGAPYDPQTKGKIKRWHQALKNRVLLEHYFLPGDFQAQIEAFVDDYNPQRYHESLNNVTPSDVYFRRDKAILQQRERIKRKTPETRRLHQRQRAA